VGGADGAVAEPTSYPVQRLAEDAGVLEVGDAGGHRGLVGPLDRHTSGTPTLIAAITVRCPASLFLIVVVLRRGRLA
jgi:hypothetical protein